MTDKPRLLSYSLAGTCLLTPFGNINASILIDRLRVLAITICDHGIMPSNVVSWSGDIQICNYGLSAFRSHGMGQTSVGESSREAYWI